ncbi:MAG: phosphatase PAP2 family protein [Nitrospira sp.]|nr:phosphatase PAP2 family protein [Nitrospira sp.]
MPVTADQDPEPFSADRDSIGPGDNRPRSGIGRLLASGCCSGAALIITFLGFSQFDLPVARYVRSVTAYRPWEQLTIPWMAFTSNAGDWIGEGTHLVVFSLVLTAAGWLWSKEKIKKAGVETLLAHGLTALIVNGLKHLIGRPRPKFTHSGDWSLAPSMTSGFDSFPSGHSAAGFAVATVLAKRFPATGPVVIGIACFVMLSRVLRGSHFPTDVIGGTVIGVVSGSIAAAPLKQWRMSIAEGLLYSAWGTCATLALLWALARPAEGGIAGAVLIVLGLAATASGLWLRRLTWKGNGASGFSTKASPLLIAYGLAAMTTSLSVVAATGLTCLAQWLGGEPVVQEKSPIRSSWSAAREVALLLCVLSALLILFGVRGVLPFR